MSSNALILRTVYALNSNTGTFLSSGQVLVTDGLGGTFWASMLSTLTINGGPIMNDLPSTIYSFSTQIYYNTTYFIGLSSLSTDMYYAISSLSTAIAQTGGSISQANLVSSIAGISQSGYVSTSGVYSIISSTNAQGQVTPSTMSTIASGMSNQSSMAGLGNLGYISSSSLLSSLNSLGNLGYVSTQNLISTVNSLGDIGYISSSSLTSSLNSLGDIGYVSTQSLTSTIDSLSELGYVSSASLVSTIEGLGSVGYLSSIVTSGTTVGELLSTVAGLGSELYVSTNSLVSTTIGIQLRNPDIRFDTTTSVTTFGSSNTFLNVNNLIYISTFLTSSIYYSGNSGYQIQGSTFNDAHSMKFSTASIDFSGFSNFINENSRITLDFYPTLAFTKLATGARNVAILPIDSFLQYGLSSLTQTKTTSFLYAGNTRVLLENNTYVDASNIFNAPIKMEIPPGTITSYTSPYNLVHSMVSSINQASFQNALHAPVITPFFGSTCSIFVSVQNIG